MFGWITKALRRWFRGASDGPRFPDGGARIAHYEFVHRVLPHKVFHDSIFLQNLQERSPEAMTAYLWEFVRTSFFRAGLRFERRRDGADQTGIRGVEAGELGCYLVTMQDARYPIEAYFAAIVFRRGDRAPDAPARERQPQRWYFTLERTADGAPTGTALCGWTEGGVHCNYGPGPAPDANAFITAVLGMVRGESGRAGEAREQEGQA